VSTATAAAPAQAATGRSERVLWLAWLVIRVAGLALITGVLFYPLVDKDVVYYHVWALMLQSGHLPWRPDFEIEYPPGVLPVMLLPGGFPVFELEFVVLAFVADGVITRTLWRRRPNGAAVWLWVLTPILLGPVVWLRLDIFVALALVGFVRCLRTGRWRLAGACLGVAALLKLWPVVLLLVLWRQIPASRRRTVLAATLGTIAAAVVPVVAWGGEPGLHYMLAYQGGRGLEMETVWAWPAVLAHSVDFSFPLVPGHGAVEVPLHGALGVAFSLILPAMLAAATAWSWSRTGRARLTPETATLLAVAVVLVGSKVLSPQYVVWAVAVVALALAAVEGPLRPCHRRVAVATGALAVTTQVIFPFLLEYVYLGWLRGDLAATAHALAVVIWFALVLDWVCRGETAALPTQLEMSSSRRPEDEGPNKAVTPASAPVTPMPAKPAKNEVEATT